MKKRILLVILSSVCAFSMIACGSEKPAVTGTEEIQVESFALPSEAEESSVYVGAIPGISEDFIRGVDVSEVISLENSGEVFYDNNGKEQDVFKTLAQNGVNYVRIRVWNNPYDSDGNGYGGGNCDLDKAIEMGRRATQYGMKVLIDFHYSDFWADPVRQLAPKDWAYLDLDEKQEALYDFTLSSLEKLHESEVDVAMVQVGNETNYGVAGEKNTELAARLIGSGAKAVRDFSKSNASDVKIAVHYTNATNKSQITGLLDILNNNQVDYDIVGLSYYMYWHGSQSAISDVMKTIKADYGKDVMMAEFSYPYTLEPGDSCDNSVSKEMLVTPYEATVQGQSKVIHDMAELTHEAGGIGIFYWGGVWVPVYANDDMTESEVWETYGSGWASSFANEYDSENVGSNFGGNGWENQALFDYEGHPLDSLSTFKYLATGTNCPKPDNYDEKPVDKTNMLTKILGDLVVNGSFEDADTSMWEVNFAGAKNPTDIQDNEQDAYTGTKALHYWSEDEMEFEVFQTVENLEEGKYTVSAFSQGGDFSEDSLVELFVIADEDMMYSEEIKNKGWANWQNPVIKDIAVSEGQSLTFGVRVNCNAKAWGTFDEFVVLKQ